MKARPDIHLAKLDKSFAKDCKEKATPYSEILNSASTSSSIKKKKWRRKRKNMNQVKVLIIEFNKNSIWSKEQVVFLAEKTGLSEAQVYKWGWDYKKKLRKQALHINTKELVCKEIMHPSKLDLEMVLLQRSYKEFMLSMNSILPTFLVF
jgi:formylmethanofuran dehydrogenase subunit B